MKGQLSNTLVVQGILICLLLGVAPLVFAGPYVDYRVSNLLGDSQATRQFNQRFSFSPYRADLLAPSFHELRQEIDTVSLLSDWHPGHGLFRLSVGVLYRPGDKKQNQLKQPYRIQTHPADIKTSFSRLAADGTSPYAGLGWGNNLWQESRLGFNVDMGVLYQPDERLLGNQAITSFEENAKFSDNDFLQIIEDFELAPVFSLGVSYSF